MLDYLETLLFSEDGNLPIPYMDDWPLLMQIVTIIPLVIVGLIISRFLLFMLLPKSILKRFFSYQKKNKKYKADSGKKKIWED